MLNFRIFSLLCWFVIIANNIANASSKLDDLTVFEWKHRIVLVKSEGDCSVLVPIFNREKSSIMERDILWFVLCQGKVRTNYTGALAEALFSIIDARYFSEIEFGSVLIGKDGSVKYTSKELSLSSMFELVDAMPMRRAEIKERS